MKLKSTLYALLMLLILVGSPALASANEAPKPKKELTAAQQARIEQMISRVEAIKKIDRSALTKAERKNLRKELKDMNAEAKAIRGQGVYLSLGALIVIVLLLILLL